VSASHGVARVLPRPASLRADESDGSPPLVRGASDSMLDLRDVPSVQANTVLPTLPEGEAQRQGFWTSLWS